MQKKRGKARTLSNAALLEAVRATGGDPRGVARIEDLTPRVAGPLGRANDLPIPVHGDSLRQELTDLLGMLDAALAEADSKPQYNSQVVYDLVRDSRALLRSILGTPQNQTHTTDGRKLPKRS